MSVDEKRAPRTARSREFAAERERALRYGRVLVSVAIVFLGALVGPTPARAQTATPEPQLPVAPAPLGLGTVTLPTDAAGIAALFARLPTAVANEPRTSLPEDEADRITANYGTLDPDFGPPLALAAMNLTTGDFEFGVDFTVADFVAIAADPAFDYGAVAFGQDGNLAWVQAETTAAVEVNQQGTPASSRPIYTLAWGEATSPWLFGAAAFSPQGLDALVSAFVVTAAAQPATPVPKATPAGVRRSATAGGLWP